MQNNRSILIGNSFPLSLIRRSVRMEPVPLAALKRAAVGSTVVSFWGHRNTLIWAASFCGLVLTPREERPVITLQEDQLPSLHGQTFRECWILSPIYVASFRPAMNAEVCSDQIAGWQILKIMWE